LYVTGGQYKGHKIITPDCARPTLSKTREGVFNILYSYFGDFSGLVFLDLFSGSGIMSLEALSRGFKTISIEKNSKAVRFIKENLKTVKENYEIVQTDAVKFLKETDIMPDVVYIDPPWEMEYEPIIKICIKKFKGSILIIESDKKKVQKLGEIYAKNLAPFKNKVYGRSILDFIKVE